MTIGVGLVGAGFLAETRARCYARARGGEVRAIHSRTPERASGLAQRLRADVCASFDELLAREDVGVVDLCLPNHLHRSFTERAAAGGKHVICTKPLAAYVGQDLKERAEDREVSARPRAEMRAFAEADARAMVDACAREGVQLAYGENWIYAPAISRARELIERASGPILEMRGWECHSGSHSPYARRWRHTGGGALLRLGAHPVGAMLHLKRVEGLRRAGTPVRPVSVTADVADLTRVSGFSADRSAIATGWVDVENWGCVVIEFDDGSRGVAYGSDNVLGGMESRLEVYAGDAHMKCNLSPNDQLRVYAPNGEVLRDAYLMEKASTPAGWNSAIPDEDASSGQLAMVEAFLSDLAAGRSPLSDGELGLDVTRVIYSAYVAAEEGRRVRL